MHHSEITSHNLVRRPVDGEADQLKNW